MRLEIKKIHFLIFVYAPIMLVLYLDQINNIPFTGGLRKLKYALIVLLILYVITSNSINKIYRGDFFLLLYFLHTILFGCFLKNSLVEENITVHFREMMIYLIFVYGLYKYVIGSHCIKEFLEISWKVMSGYLILVALLHFREFVNPMYYPFSFTRNLRIRSAFGFVQYNKCGYAVYIALIAGLVLFELYRERRLIKKRWLIINLGIYSILLCMLFSTGGRGSITAFILTVVLYICFLLMRYKFKYFIITVAIMFALLLMGINIAIYTGTFSDLGEISQRGMNISVNYPIFKEIGKYWTGMGYVNMNGFASDIFGYDTWNIDMYYVYIFFTTGVLGCLIIATGILSMIFGMIRHSKKLECSIVGIPVFVGMLFAAIWDVNFFTYDNVSSVFAATLVLLLGSYNKKHYMNRRRN